MAHTMSLHAQRSRGLTLLELMIGLAVLALVASLALPSFASVAGRTRLKQVAETLAADIAEARFDAARRGQPMHVEFQDGPQWCWAVAASPGCSCGTPQSCQLKTVQARDHGGVALVQAAAVQLQGTGGVAAASQALFQSAQGEQLRVDVSPLGRAVVCAPGGAVPGYMAC